MTIYTLTKEQYKKHYLNHNLQRYNTLQSSSHTLAITEPLYTLLPDYTHSTLHSILQYTLTNTLVLHVHTKDIRSLLLPLMHNRGVLPLTKHTIETSDRQHITSIEHFLIQDYIQLDYLPHSHNTISIIALFIAPSIMHSININKLTLSDYALPTIVNNYPPVL